MKKVFFLLIVTICSFSFAQETSSIRGKILDGEQFNEPLIMASISINDTPITTRTNFRGNFEFTDITPGSHEIIIQFLGYKSIQFTVDVKAGDEVEILETLYAKSLALPSLSKVSSISDVSMSKLELSANKTR
ncbi:carboxypeptidase-like regulatory domain-containing protein [uncultured Maribacter sp.]|uniref:carboxypeptidase-like regulatory domain-containing protein n=1 Tax=uncultured Maribacter sp. TaxID=431308 RepID=UPI0030DDC66F